jgi:hypothetical protein
MAYFSTLKMKAVGSSETSDYLRATRPYNPEDSSYNEELISVSGQDVTQFCFIEIILYVNAVRVRLVVLH